MISATTPQNCVIIEGEEVQTLAGQTVQKIDRNAERLIIARAREGDPAALRELVDLHKDRLFAFVWRMVRNHHEAEEICQDAFLKAFHSFGSFSIEYRFSTWLFTIGYRVCLNTIRRKKALTGEMDFSSQVHPGADEPDAVFESREASRLRQGIWAAVDRLSPPQKATVVLFYRHEMSCQEIARVLEFPVATVKSHLHRARNRLRELLEAVNEQDLKTFRNRLAASG